MATPKFKVSFDGKTIIDLPEGQSLFGFIRKNVSGAKEVIRNTFTDLDLVSGYSKKLIVHCPGKPSVEVFAGKTLDANDLKAQYDSFGSVMKSSTSVTN